MVCLRDNINNKITVATLDGKSYYKIINILKTLQIDYEELSPYDYWQFWRNTDDRDVKRFIKFFR